MQETGDESDGSWPQGVSRPSYPIGLSAGTATRFPRFGAGQPTPGRQVTPDFSQIDFLRLWAGRHRVTEVEGEILVRAIAGEPRGRGLELGAGGGRLTPYLSRWSSDIVSVDATVSLLRWNSTADEARPPRVGATAYHLPFASAVFGVATLVRVFGFLSDPEAALRELHRVLRPGGLLVLSFEPHPSVGTLIDDLKVGLGPTTHRNLGSMTFSRERVVPVRPSAYPAWSHTRIHARRLAEAAGFVLEAEYPCGLEDFRGLRRFRPSVFLSISRALSRVGGFPTRFLLLRKRAPGGSPTP